MASKRGAGERRIKRLPDGRYEWEISVGGWGQRRRRSGQTTRRSDAVDAVREARRELERDAGLPIDQTTGEYLRWWVDTVLA